LGLEIFNHPNPHTLGWVHHNASLEVTKYYKLKFGICGKCIDEIIVDVVPLVICGVILNNPYLWHKDDIYYTILNKLLLVKYGKVFLASTYNNRKKATFGHYQSSKMPCKVF